MYEDKFRFEELLIILRSQIRKLNIQLSKIKKKIGKYYLNILLQMERERQAIDRIKRYKTAMLDGMFPQLMYLTKNTMTMMILGLLK